jgi:hypothetical protein
MFLGKEIVRFNDSTRKKGVCASVNILVPDDPRLFTAPTQTAQKVTLLTSLSALCCVKFKIVWARLTWPNLYDVVFFSYDIYKKFIANSPQVISLYCVTCNIFSLIPAALFMHDVIVTRTCF